MGDDDPWTWENIDRFKFKEPKIQLIAPTATASKVCDVATAYRAKPIMGCTTPAEAREVSRVVDATFLSFGTPTTADMANAVLDAPIVVVDPVGVGLPERGRMVSAWLDARRCKRFEVEGQEQENFCTIIKGNASEMATLVKLFDMGDGERFANSSVTTASEGKGWFEQTFGPLDDEHRQDTRFTSLDDDPTSTGGTTFGIDSSFVDEHMPELYNLACYLDATLVMTGPFDVILDPYTSLDSWTSFLVRTRSTEMFDTYAGAGCALGAACAAQIGRLHRHSISSDELRYDFIADVPRVLAWTAAQYREAGAVSAANARGPGSFQAEFLDKLYLLYSLKEQALM